jgi:hypothetical protein
MLCPACHPALLPLQLLLTLLLLLLRRLSLLSVCC